VGAKPTGGGSQKLASGPFQTEPQSAALRGVVRCTNLDAVKIHQFRHHEIINEKVVVVAGIKANKGIRGNYSG